MPMLRDRCPIFKYADHNYVIVHCTGYVKSSPPINVQAGQDAGACLVAIARLQFPNMFHSPIELGKPEQIIFRVNKSGTITFMDNKTQQQMNLSSMDVMGKNIWEFVHPMDEQLVKDTIKASTQSPQHQVIFVVADNCPGVYFDFPLDLGGLLQVALAQSTESRAWCTFKSLNGCLRVQQPALRRVSIFDCDNYLVGRRRRATGTQSNKSTKSFLSLEMQRTF